MSKPEWVGILEKTIKENEKYTTYALSTLTQDGKPKVRHVIHRGITPSNLLLTTTDTRMQKPPQLQSHPILELAWWIEPPAVQFRITGKGYPILPDPKDCRSISAESVQALGAKGKEADLGFWKDKRMEAWKKEMSGHLRASFARPAPGTPLSEVESPDTWPEKLDAESDDPKENELIEQALSHFALIAIVPDEAEYLELKPMPNRRTQWRSKAGEWEKTGVAP